MDTLVTVHQNQILTVCPCLPVAAGGTVAGPAQLHHHDALHQQPGEPQDDDEHAAREEQEYSV